MTVTSEYIWPVYFNRVKLDDEEEGFKMLTEQRKYKKDQKRKTVRVPKEYSIIKQYNVYLILYYTGLELTTFESK